MTEKTIAIYVRANGPRADTSLVVQTDACRRLSERLGCASPQYFLERNAPEVGIGEALDRLIAACKRGSFHTLVTASRDRLHRDPVRYDRVMKFMADNGVVVRFLDEDGSSAIDPF